MRSLRRAIKVKSAESADYEPRSGEAAKPREERSGTLGWDANNKKTNLDKSAASRLRRFCLLLCPILSQPLSRSDSRVYSLLRPNICTLDMNF